MINVERMIHPWQRLGSGRGFVAARAASGVPARRGLPACGALTIAVAYRLQKLAQKGDKVGACLTEVRIGRGGRAGSSAAKIGGESRAALGDGLLRWSYGPADSSRKSGRGLRRCAGG